MPSFQRPSLSSIRSFLIALLLCCFLMHQQNLSADISQDIAHDAFTEGVFVDLRNPSYKDGIITTEQGGVITGPNIRIQAIKIIYTRKTVDDKLIFTITAQEKVMVEFGKGIFIGDYLEYNFQTKSGFILNGKTTIEPWYLGGERIDLLPDGNYYIHQGYLTTAENDIIDWRIQSQDVWLSKNYYLRSRNLKFWYYNTPIFWLPAFSADLNTFFDSPIKYTGGTGGRQGPRFGIVYEFYSTEKFKSALRFDYRIKRGFRGGIETKYDNPNKLERFYTLNYLARDISLYNRHNHFRYRFYGLYHNETYSGRTSLHLTYDKVSDPDMPSDYYDQGIELKSIKKTQLSIRHQQNESSVSNFTTHVRINNFQTIKQELPTLSTNFHPQSLGRLGIISDSRFKTSYLSYKYDNDLRHVHDFSSSRLELQQRIYRPFFWGPVVATPELGVTSIHYGSSPGGAPKWLTLGTFQYTVNTHLLKRYPQSIHMIIPYTIYTYDTFPTVAPESHYIFDLQDGWYRLNMLRFGVKNLVYISKDCSNCNNNNAMPYFTADLYANAFFFTPTIPFVIPKAYAFIVWNPIAYLRYSTDSAWDLEHNQIDHVNIRQEVTFSENLALAIEFRHRSAYSWRKVVPCNFILESFRTERALRHSTLSDKRDTLLFHTFYRFRPTWSLELQARYGRRHKPQGNFLEYQIDLTKSFHSAWHVKISYQNQESDKRIAFSAFLNLYKP